MTNRVTVALDKTRPHVVMGRYTGHYVSEEEVAQEYESGAIWSSEIWFIVDLQFLPVDVDESVAGNIDVVIMGVDRNTGIIYPILDEDSLYISEEKVARVLSSGLDDSFMFFFAELDFQPFDPLEIR